MKVTTLLLALFVAAAPRAFAAIGDVGAAAYGCQSIPAGSGSHVLNFNQGFGANAGETAIIVGTSEANLVPGTVTDSAGMNAWTPDMSSVPSSRIFLISSRLTTAIPSGGTVTLSYTNSAVSAKESCLTLVVFSGLWKSGAYLDQTATAQGSGNPVSISTSNAITQPDELVLGGLFVGTSFFSFTNDPGTSTRNPAVGGTFGEIPIYAITNSTGVKTLSGSFSPGSPPWAVALASYRGCGTDPVAPAVGAPGPVTVTQTICQ